MKRWLELDSPMKRRLSAVVFALFTGMAASVPGAGVEPVRSLAAREKPALLETLKELVSIESGSGDIEGLDRLAALIARKLEKLGGAVETTEPGADLYRMSDTPDRVGKMVQATFTGRGTKKILLLCHMDTVYPRDMIDRQPFRIEGDRAYGLGIADAKQGIALILHTIAILNAMKFQDYGTLTVLINGDEEISSPGSRGRITRLGSEHHAALSFEASRVDSDKVALATSGIAAVTLTVKGRGAHSGYAPEQGVNALYELAHQLLQTRDLSDPAVGLKMNWTLARAGVARNMIPPAAQATADVRVLRVADYDAIERKINERIRNRLLPEAQVEMTFERRRPPLEATAASRALGRRARAIYREIGRDLVVDDAPEGAGTDAAFAALGGKTPVIERFGLQGYGEHSTEAEYVALDSIEPRLYLTARLIMELSQEADSK
jgi:glutamate carboxypeptidase